MSKRTAIVHNVTDLSRVAAYLPNNYDVHEGDGVLVIIGEDHAGWTLDGYVLPRLASGMIFATEQVIPPGFPLGSISHGTHRAIDLLDAFLPVLEEWDDSAYDAVMQNGGDAAQAWRLGWMHDDENQWVVVAQDWLSEEVWPAMEELAPEGVVFGSHPGDGADFGFWEIPSEEEG